MNKKILLAILIIIIAGAGIWYSNIRKAEDVLPAQSQSVPDITSQTEKMTETETPPSLVAQAVYTCEGGKTIEAAFYKGESKPVNPGEPPIPTGSVKIKLSDGRNFDLSQTISADGGRYANSDESFVFWSKGDGALVLENGAEKDYKGCVVKTEKSDAQGIKLISPNGGEKWSKGQKVQISWSAPEEVKTVNIRLAVKGDGEGQTFNASVAAGVPNTGSYEWTVQEVYAEVMGVKDLPVSDEYTVTVEDKEHNNIFDSSDGIFSIKD